MAWDLFLKLVGKETAELVQTVGNVWSDGLDKAQYGDGYTTDDMLLDARAIGDQVFNLMATALMVGPRLLLPVARVTYQIKDTLDSGTQRRVLVPQDLSGSPDVAVSLLRRVEDDGATTLEAALVLDPPNGILVTAPKDPVPVTIVDGTYHGTITLDDKIVASVILRVLPKASP